MVIDFKQHILKLKYKQLNVFYVKCVFVSGVKDANKRKADRDESVEGKDESMDVWASIH